MSRYRGRTCQVGPEFQDDFVRVSIHGGLLFAGSNGACLPKGRSFQHQASFGVGSWEGKAPLITPNLAGADFDLKADGERRGERERERE